MTTTTQRTVRRFAKTDFAAMLAVIGFIFALLCSKWAGAAEPPAYRLPGSCVVTTQLVTQGGAQRIVKHYRCEYTQAQLNRMAREGR